MYGHSLCHWLCSLTTILTNIRTLVEGSPPVAGTSRIPGARRWEQELFRGPVLEFLEWAAS